MNIVIKNEKLNMTLAHKWNKASSIWHSQKEIQVLKELLIRLELKSKASVIDVACGVGFHSLFFYDYGLNVVSCDIDEGNLKKLNISLCTRGINIPLIKADWQTIGSIIKNKYDAVFCLGSSITYFESWNENQEINQNNRVSKLINILENYKELMAKNASLIIGYSKHYYTDKTKTTISFGKKILEDGIYEMNWHLFFDWKEKIKKWKCEIKDHLQNDYSFSLNSHLYSLEEFQKICRHVFNTVEVIDIDENYYDVFIICK